MAVQTVSANNNSVSTPIKMDFVLFAIVAALIVVGLVMVWSVTFAPRVSLGEDPLTSVAKQGLFAFAGLILLVAFSQLNYHLWGRWAVWMMLGTLGVLLVLLFMPATFGSRRWLMDGSIQPGEVAKFAIIVYMAKWLSSKGEKLRNVTYGLLPFSIIVGLACGLIILQPNISTAIIIGLCAFAMFFIAGADLIQFAFLMIVGGVSSGILVWQMPHAFARFQKYMQDPLTLGQDGFQIIETLISLGSGGLTGRGLGGGYGKFGWVTAAHTDSIFAILGEETGLIGTLAVLALFLALAYRGFRIAARTEDPFGQVLAAGLTFWLVFQAFINVAVVTATIPFTGVPLPFISYGGSSLIMAMAAVGVLLNISRNPPALKESKETNATVHIGGRDGGTRVPRADRRRRDTTTRIR
jgi:cell division protein FtsW